MRQSGADPPDGRRRVVSRRLSLKQEEADPGPARVALAAPAHAVLSHGRVGAAAARLGVAAAARARLLVARPAARARARPARPARAQTREVQVVLYHTTHALPHYHISDQPESLHRSCFANFSALVEARTLRAYFQIFKKVGNFSDGNMLVTVYVVRSQINSRLGYKVVNDRNTMLAG